jgi:hypothetical protein
VGLWSWHHCWYNLMWLGDQTPQRAPPPAAALAAESAPRQLTYDCDFFIDRYA